MKERLNVVRLQSACLGAFHVFADAANPAGIHGVVGKSPLFEKVPQPVTIERVLHHLCQASPNLGLISIADGFNK